MVCEQISYQDIENQSDPVKNKWTSVLTKDIYDQGHSIKETCDPGHYCLIKGHYCLISCDKGQYYVIKDISCDKGYYCLIKDIKDSCD